MIHARPLLQALAAIVGFSISASALALQPCPEVSTTPAWIHWLGYGVLLLVLVAGIAVPTLALHLTRRKRFGARAMCVSFGVLVMPLVWLAGYLFWFVFFALRC